MDQTTLAESDAFHEENVYLEEAVAIVVAYIANNRVPASVLPDLIASVHASLLNLRQVVKEPEQQVLQPPVSIKKSVTPAYLISMEDGRQYKALKRHLTSRGMTPDQYRQKWNLPADYPMIASDYAEKRSQLAKAGGLGRRQIRRPARAS